MLNGVTPTTSTKLDPVNGRLPRQIPPSWASSPLGFCFWSRVVPNLAYQPALLAVRQNIGAYPRRIRKRKDKKLSLSIFVLPPLWQPAAFGLLLLPCVGLDFLGLEIWFLAEQGCVAFRLFFFAFSHFFFFRFLCWYWYLLALTGVASSCFFLVAGEGGWICAKAISYYKPFRWFLCSRSHLKQSFWYYLSFFFIFLDSSVSWFRKCRIIWKCNSDQGCGS